MSEVWGTIVIPNLKEFSGFEISNITDRNQEFVATIFEVGGFNAKALNNGDYSIEEATLLDDYFVLSILGQEWIPFASSAMREDRNLEFYGVFGDEYGTCMYFARNSEGDSFNYSYEDDGGDESEQDYFDIEQYKKDHANKEKKYLSLLPEEIKSSCDGMKPKTPLFLIDEE